MTKSYRTKTTEVSVNRLNCRELCVLHEALLCSRLMLASRDGVVASLFHVPTYRGVATDFLCVWGD